MRNNRPIENRKLQRTLNSIQATIENAGLAGAVMLVSEDEAAYGYVMHAPWSAIKEDPRVDLGFRIRAKSAEIGNDQAHKLLLGAAHTICQLSDFGEQTVEWMEQLKLLLRQAGVEFDHRPFNGQPLPGLTSRPPGEAAEGN